MKIDLQQESKEFRKWVEQKAATAVSRISGAPEQGRSALPTSSASAKSVGAVVAMYNYDQGGWIALDFNTDEEFQYGGDVSKAAWDDLFDRPTWTPLVTAKEPEQLTLVEADGTHHSLRARDVTDAFFSGQLGKMIASVLVTTWSEGLFAPLPLRPGFVFIVDDFNGGWAWGAKEVSGKLDDLTEF